MHTTNGPLAESLEPRLLLDGSGEGLAVGIGGIPDEPSEGAEISLSADVTGAEPGAIVSYAWQVFRGGSGYAAGEDATLAFTPDDEGDYSVALTVTADGEQAAADPVLISVLNVAPTVELPGSGGGGPALLPNGDFSQGWVGWQDTGFTPAQIVGEQLVISVTNVFAWLPDDPIDPSAGGMWDLLLPPDSDLFSTVQYVLPNAPPGTTGLGFDATLTVTDSVGGSTAQWVTVQVSQQLTLPAGAQLDPAAVPPDDYYSIDLTGFDIADFIEIDIFTANEFLLDAVPYDPNGLTITIEATLDNFVWEGAGGGAALEADEGQTVTIVPTVTDPGADALAYDWQITKDGAAYGSGTDETLAFTPDDNATYVVTLTVSDGDGGQDSASVTYAVANVAPTLAAAGPADGVGNLDEPLAVTLQPADVSPVDQAGDFTYVIDWGDGTAPETLVGPAGLAVTHPYQALGTFSVSVTATDKDGGTSGPAAAAVEIMGSALADGELLVLGASTADRVEVTGGAAITVTIDRDGDGVADWSRTYDAAAVDGIVLHGLDGDDEIVVHDGVWLPVALYGGAGDDVLQGGSGSDVIDGGDGNDMLVGGAGGDVIFGGAGDDQLTGSADDDFLIGGDGTDRIVGSSGHDVLVAGEVDPAYDVDALRAILADWAAGRIEDGGEDPTEDPIVTDDDYDSLTGSSGSDWFVISVGDKVTDFKVNRKQQDQITYDL